MTTKKVTFAIESTQYPLFDEDEDHEVESETSVSISEPAQDASLILTKTTDGMLDAEVWSAIYDIVEKSKRIRKWTRTMVQEHFKMYDARTVVTCFNRILSYYTRKGGFRFIKMDSRVDGPQYLGAFKFWKAAMELVLVQSTKID
jgi:hypothetical protein